MANSLTGKVIAISDRQTIASKDANKQPMIKRQFFMDCTRFDPYTGERGFENTPLLEFSNKGLEKLEALMQQGLKAGDIVTISFDIQGVKYQDKDKKTQVFTSIRPYNIEKVQPRIQQPAQNAPAAAPQQPAGQAAAPAGEVVPGIGNDLPF